MKLCLFTIAILFSFSVFAQPERGYVYLKNGTILKGRYQYTEDLKKLTIRSAGNYWVFDTDMIDTITSVSARRNLEIKERENESPLFYRTEIGVLAGNSENSQSAPFSFTASANYLVLPKFSAGAGFGVEFLKESYLPVFANFEYKMRNSVSTPYLFLKAGYQVPIEESRTVYYDIYPAWSSIWPNPDQWNSGMDAKGGLLLNPGLGYHRMFSSTFGMSFAFGYQFHRLGFSGENDYRLEIDYNRLTVKLGIIFK